MNLFLHLAFADVLESYKRLPEAKEVYKRIIKHTTGNNTLAYIHYIRFLRRTEVWQNPVAVRSSAPFLFLLVLVFFRDPMLDAKLL